MTSIDIETLFTILFVELDDWYLEKGHQFLAGKAGRNPVFSDSEMMTLMLAAEYLPFASESQYLGFVRANHSDLFPNLLSQSQFNRRARGLRERIEGVFHELQNSGRNLEQLLAKTVDGLATRLIAKVTANLFKHILRLRYRIDVQTFQQSSHFT